LGSETPEDLQGFFYTYIIMPIDYKKYPTNWKTEIRPRILERANNCCETCNVPNYSIIYRPDGEKWELAPEGHQADAMVLDGVKFIKIILTIAHLDHDETNFDVKDDRLKAMCQRCHLRYDAPEKARRRAAKKNVNQVKLF